MECTLIRRYTSGEMHFHALCSAAIYCVLRGVINRNSETGHSILVRTVSDFIDSGRELSVNGELSGFVNTARYSKFCDLFAYFQFIFDNKTGTLIVKVLGLRGKYAQFVQRCK